MIWGAFGTRGYIYAQPFISVHVDRCDSVGCLFSVRIDIYGLSASRHPNQERLRMPVQRLGLINMECTMN